MKLDRHELADHMRAAARLWARYAEEAEIQDYRLAYLAKQVDALHIAKIFDSDDTCMVLIGRENKNEDTLGASNQ
jgi:hypothetical protein